MRAFLIQLLLVALLLGKLLPVLTSDVYAQNSGISKGSKGRISKEELRAHVERQEEVAGHIIQGDDLIAIIRETKLTIKISNSIIEDGLDFTTLPTTPLAHVELPKSWNDKEREAWIARQRQSDIKDIHVIGTRLYVTGTEIRPIPHDSPTSVPVPVNARAALFQRVIFEGTTFSGRANFDQASFSDGAYFKRASFSDGAAFGRTKFSGWASFDEASFSGRVNFDEASFSDGAAFDQASFDGGAAFDQASFSGIAGFRRAKFSQWANFRNASFSGVAAFECASFSGIAGFSGAKFSQWANFRNASFSSVADFRGQADFHSVSFSNEALFEATSFSGPVSFSHAKFSGEAFFERARFGGEVDFWQVIFSMATSFSGAAFDGPAHYRSTEFSGEALFQDVRFSKVADFVSVRFKGLTSFWKMEADGPVLFTNTRFGDRAIFRRARFGQATFTPDHTTVQQLQTGRVREETSRLLPAIFFNRADFREATFGEVYLGAVSFEEVDFTGAVVIHTLDLGDATYRRLIINDLHFEILGSPNRDTLKRLEDNFRASGQVPLANQAFYRRMVIERSERPPLLEFGELIFLDWPSGYGVRPLNTVGVSIALIVLFALLYHAADVVRYRVSPWDANFRLRLADIPIISMEDEEAPRAQPSSIRSRMQRVWDALSFSFSVYTKLGTGRRVARKWYWVVIVEWVLGLVMITVFFYALSNTVPILHRLLSAVV